MKRIIQLLAIGAACVAGRGQTTNQPSTQLSTNSSEIAELKAEVAALRRQVEVLTVALQHAQQAQPQAQKQHGSSLGAGTGSPAGAAVSGGSSVGTGRQVSFSTSGQPTVTVNGVTRLRPNRSFGSSATGTRSPQPVWVDGAGVSRLAPARPNR